MTIPVRNIYYLLLYAWGHFKSGGVREVGVDKSPDLPNLLGKVLNEGSHRLLRRGLDRGYIEATEETRSPRGKLRLDIMTKQQTLLRGYAVCDLDDLTPDVLHNQVLKASLVSLANCADVKMDLRHELQTSARRMAGVSSIKLSASLFHRVQLSRNTSQYGFLIRVCELVFHALLPDDHGGGAKFQSILEDETRMPALFEDFLRNFYRAELPGYSANAEIMPWLAEAADEADLAYLPIMKTDITLRSGNRTIVADAKYYKEILAGGRYDPKVRSAHLYQLSTYLAHIQAKEPGKELSGLLIYPSVGKSLRLRYRLLGIPVTVATVDLNTEWKDIHHELVGLTAEGADEY
ncbi:5-methylcytosine-specific restriction endonuclease system specificity protein McrC [Pseudophaeobacter arcticus]|uniref:5-methylcytosine-specific restriction endonuclease system specificity protein McrC n=1 Tax=Pseudophaeobacter arcticus TaxID=385492 RepID=A0ABQ0AS51_9RHOB